MRESARHAAAGSLLLLVFGLCAGLLLASDPTPPTDRPLLITEAKLWVAADPADAEALRDDALPAADASWHAVALPYHWVRSNFERPGLAWLQLDFVAPDPLPQNPALYLSRLSIGGSFFVNGTRIVAMRVSDETSQVRSRRPHLILIPPAMLRPGHNRILARIVTRDASTFFPELQFGSEAALRPDYDRRYLAEYSGAQFSAAAAAVVGLFMLAIWWFRRSDLLYLLFGLTCLFWALRTQAYLTEVVPWDWWWPWRALYYVWTGSFALSVAAFFLCYIGRLRQRWQLSLVAYAFIGPALLLLSNGALQSFVARYWIGGLFVLEFFVLWSFFRWLPRHPSLEGFALAGAALITFLLAGNDFAVRSGWMPYSNAYAMHFGAPVVMLAMGGLLAARFVKALRQVEISNQDLTQKVREKEQELSAQYQLLREVERREAGTAERQRIMQDMHDGLGSQLLTSLAAVERGALDSKGMAQVLRDAMDEMRLAIDTLSPGREGLLEALGNLRYRLEPRFRAAGVELRFSFRDLPEQLPVAAADALQILRVLQESLTNSLKHAGAKAVAVEISLLRDPACFLLAVTDDGAGFDPASSAAGRGLSGMRRRAQRIGAGLEIASGAGGTRITLTYPLPTA